MSSSHHSVGELVVYDKPMRKHAARNPVSRSTIGARIAPNGQDTWSADENDRSMRKRTRQTDENTQLNAAYRLDSDDRSNENLQHTATPVTATTAEPGLQEGSRR